jgi:hypothetical protein
MRMKYEEFLKHKGDIGTNDGFEPVWMPDFLYDFQQTVTDWSIRKGKSAEFADCGLGKTPMQLVWGENVIRKTNRPVLDITPLAVSHQTVMEGEKFGIEVIRCSDGKIKHPAIYVTNYERLHRFNPDDFVGVICDESSAIKDFEGQRQAEVVQFLKKMPYRLLCTATASPNDYIELGTSAEALGQMGRMDMLSTFFKNDENSLHPIWWGARWRFKAHAEEAFWRWVVSWARAFRKPSDLGFSDGAFKLPPLVENEHVVAAERPREGCLFDMPAVTLAEQREERRLTMDRRCELVCKLVNHNKPALVWCHLNKEGDLLERLIPGAVQVSGSDSDEAKEEKLLAFTTGQARVLISKPTICAFGLNWQHCNHMTFFPSHSFEQYYQGVRRCWRFGQKNPVTVDIVTSEGELGVMKNLQRKAEAADKMFSILVREMNNELKLTRSSTFETETEVPTWLLKAS